ncbi:DUF5336 domain-containing protein [Lentzea sp. NPDC059081]|uniref:DUF5336 domain-containing protein n=1 Tax=Lentzea sp. NPDC059081 TaxID=3346719 RepID=UPI0036A3EB3C
MSVPYGAPQQQPPGPAQHQAPHQAPGAPGANSINLSLILPLVAAGLGLVAYLVAFADDVNGNVTYLLAAGLLAGLSVLPNVPRGFVPVAAVLAAVQTLLQLQGIIKVSSVQGLDIVLLIVALLETAAIVLTFLLAEGIVKFEPKPANPYAGQQQGQPGGWNPQSGAFPQQQAAQHPQSGAFPAQPQAAPQQSFGQQSFGQQPQQPAQQQPGQPPQQTSFMPQPGQFGSPGTPPGGFGGPQQ